MRTLGLVPRAVTGKDIRNNPLNRGFRVKLRFPEIAQSDDWLRGTQRIHALRKARGQSAPESLWLREVLRPEENRCNRAVHVTDYRGRRGGAS